MPARDELYKRINDLAEACNEPVLVSKTISSGGKAKLFINGLSIMGFCILEDFIKKRTGEVFGEIDKSNLPFNALPKKIQNVSTIGVIKALSYRSKINKSSGVDWLKYIQKHAKCVSSTSENIYALSSISIGYDKPNLSPEDVKGSLNIFQVDDPWNNIGKLCQRTGITIPSPLDSFRNAAERRHSAAHDTNSNISYSDLENFNRESIALALGYDLLISSALQFILDNDYDYLTKNKRIDEKVIELIFMDQSTNGKMRIIRENRTKALKICNSESEAERYAISMRKSKFEYVVIRNQSGIPTKWF